MTAKPLTVKQYTFYKERGMTDSTVMKQHGLNNASFYAWKKENNLNGVKFNKNVEVTKGSEVKPLKENDIAKERLTQTISEYEANKKVKERIDGKALIPKGVPDAPMSDRNHSGYAVASQQLAERVSKEQAEQAVAETIEKLTAAHKLEMEKLQKEKEEVVSELFETRKVNEDLRFSVLENLNLYKEAQMRVSLLSESDTSEVLKLKSENKWLKEQLEQERQKDSLLTNVMKLYVTEKERELS